MTAGNHEIRNDALSDRIDTDLRILYRVALLLNGDETTASRLVRDAFAGSASALESSLDRRYQRLHRVLTGKGFANPEVPQSSPLSSAVVGNIIESKFPVAFVALAPTEQVLLLLAHQDEYDVHEAISFLQLSDEDFAIELDAAKSRLLDLFLQSLSSTERGLVLDQDEDEWLGRSVRATLDLLMPNIPDELRRTIAAAQNNERSDSIDRKQPADPIARGKLSLRRTVVAGVVMAGILAGSLWWLSSDKSVVTGNVDLLALTVSTAKTVKPDVTGSSEQVAEEYIFDQTGRKIVVPQFTGATLAGASIERVAGDLSVPALSYFDQLGAEPAPFTVFVYLYRMLGSADQGPRIASTVLRSLDNEITFTRASSASDTLLVWRHRANIYVAVGQQATINSLDGRTELQSPFGSR